MLPDETLLGEVARLLVAVSGQRRRRIAPTLAKAVQHGISGNAVQAVRKLFADRSQLVWVLPTERWVRGPLGEHWQFACRAVDDRGTQTIAELRVFPRLGDSVLIQDELDEPLDLIQTLPAGGLTARVLRQLNIGAFGPMMDAMATEVRQIVALMRQGMEQENETPEGLEALGSELDWSNAVGSGPAIPRAQWQKELRWLRRHVGGRQRIPDGHYAAIAQRYVEVIRNGERHPVKRVAEELRWNTPRVRDAIHHARRRGLLTCSPKQGVMGGHLTEKAIALLQRRNNVGS
jgi:hypothetical protein